MKVFIKGLNSCTMRKQKLHQYREFLVSNGHEVVNKPDDSDVILLWTCAFRGDVRDNSISEIERYQQEFKAELIVAGCLPDIDPELLRKSLSGHVIAWRNDKDEMEEYFGSKNCRFEDIPLTFAEENLCDDVETFRIESPDKDVMFHDQFIKLVVSEGCGRNCAYCSERLAFPPYRSFPLKKIVEACRTMIKQQGHYEVVLLADSLGEYGKDTGSSLPVLIQKLADIHPAVKVALNNLNPVDFMRYLDEMKTFLEKGVIQHLNLPIQSASDRILKLMNRPYTKQDIDNVFGLFNNIGFTEFDTHIIVGFPGETDKDFEETINCIVTYKPKYVLASKYMEAMEMPSFLLSNKVDEAVVQNSIQRFLTSMQQYDIICNVEGGDIMKSRLCRLNNSMTIR